MSRLSTSAGALCALGLLAVAACSSDEPSIEYEPYAGPAPFPDRRPKLPAPKGIFAYVSDNGSDTVSVLDLPSNEVVAQVPVGRDPIGIDGPHHLAVDPRGIVYVALSYPAPPTAPGPHAAHSSSTRPGWVLKLAPDDLHILGEVQIDPNPGEIVLSPDGSKLIVTHFDLARAIDPKLDAEGQKATVGIIDPASLVVDGTPSLRTIKTCRAPHGASIAPDGKTAYVACYGDDALAIVDLVDPKAAVSMVPVGSKGPYSAVLNASGSLVAVGNTDGKETKIFDVATRTMKTVTVVSQGAPYFPAWSRDDAKLWIPTQAPDALVVADAVSGAVVKQRVFDASSCQRPHEAVLGAEDGLIYLVCEGDHKSTSVVLALDPNTLETRSTMRVGVYPDRFALPGRR